MYHQTIKYIYQYGVPDYVYGMFVYVYGMFVYVYGICLWFRLWMYIEYFYWLSLILLHYPILNGLYIILYTYKGGGSVLDFFEKESVKNIFGKKLLNFLFNT